MCVKENPDRKKMRKENIGFYRDDGLGILQNISGPEIEQKKKRIIQNFKGCRHNIAFKTNLKTVDFCDVRFDLINNTYQPYGTLNSEPVYINKYSNHPPNISKELPKVINKQVIDVSCNQYIFYAAKTT